MHLPFRNLLTTVAIVIALGYAGWLSTSAPAFASDQVGESDPAVGPLVFRFDESTAALTLRLDASGSALQLLESGSVIFSRPFHSITQLTIDGNGLDNTLTVDVTHGNPIPTGGLFYNGLGQQTAVGDSLVIVGSEAVAASAYQPTDLTDGVLTVGNRLITFTGLEPLFDSVPATELAFNGIAGPNSITYSAGSGGGSFTGSTGLISAVASGIAFETIEFNNKTNLILNGLDRVDSFTLNNATVPTGLTSVTINGGAGDDTIDLVSVGAVPFTANGDAGTDEVRVFGTGTGTVSLGNATFNVESLAFQIDGTTPGTDYDQIVSSGTVDISGATLTLGGTLTPAIGQAFTLIETNGGVTDTFSGLAEGATIADFFGTGVNAAITYQGGDGDDVVLTVTGCPITVQNTNDSGAGSLRQAIADLCDGGVIDFAAGLSGQTITLTSGELSLNQTATVTGSVPITISGGNASRIFSINSSGVVTLAGLTLRDGSATPGGAINNIGGTVYIQASSILSNTAATGDGGGVHNSSGTVTVSGSTIVSNTANTNGGGLYNDSGTMTLVSSDVLSNTALNRGGGLFNVNGLMILASSSVLSNTAGDWGGGLVNFGASAAMTLTILKLE